MPTAHHTHPVATAAITWSALLPQREYLVRYAERRLLDPSLAEDLVHDVFEAVMTGRAAFAGRSALRSWLVAILKHKIVDLIRDRAWHHSLDAMAGDGEESLFDIECPHPGPEQVAADRQALRRALERIQELPQPLRQAMHLRVLHDADTDQACETLAISKENLFVRLHRARKQLLS